MPRTPISHAATLLAVLLLSAPSLNVLAAPARNFSPRIIAYVSTWTKVETIDAKKLTHINYAFAKVRGDDTVVFEEPEAPAVLARLRALKQANPSLKIMLAIGGWGAEWFSDAALTEASRCRFATSAIALMTEHELDGLDIDWEYPGQRGAGNRFRADDKRNFTLLLRQLRYELDVLSDARRRKGADRYTLSIASSGGRYFQFTEMERLHVYLDWINVMTYDFVGSAPLTGHHAALTSTAVTGPLSAEAFVAQHLAAGIPREKIVVGVPFYGKRWFWVNRASPTGIAQPYDLYRGDIAYAELQRELLNDPAYVRGWDSAAQAPYLWNREIGTFVSYEDTRSLTAKAAYIKKNNLGGVMYWEHRHDPDQTLLTALYNALRGRRRAGR